MISNIQKDHKNIFPKILLITVFLNFQLSIFNDQLKAQSELSVFTATGRAGLGTTFTPDYHSIGINPANLGIEYSHKHFTLGFGELSFAVHSEALTRKELRKSLRNADTLNTQEKIDASKNFTDAGVAFNMGFTPVAISIYIPGEDEAPDVGGFAFGIRERIQWYSKFNKLTSEIFFRGYNAQYENGDYYFDIRLNSSGNQTTNPDSVVMGISNNPKYFSEIFDGTILSLSWYREYNLSYGRKIAYDEINSLSLYGGIGIKYLQGIGIAEVNVVNGKLVAYSAITPWVPIDYGAVNKDVALPRQKKGIPKAVGNGLGTDLGLSFVVKNKYKFAVALSNFGFIIWNKNTFEIIDTRLDTLKSDGFNSFDFFSEIEKITGDSGIFIGTPMDKKKELLPTVFRFGVSHKLEDKAMIGLDLVIPVNEVPGNYQRPVVSIGGDFILTKGLRIYTGFMWGGNFGTNFPVGMTWILGKNQNYELSVSSTDIITFFRQNRPTLSLNAGLIRWTF